jgi:eukaryotic-like serine/threonine-protein kinase
VAEPIDPQALENASRLEHGGRTAAAARAYLDAGAVQEAARVLRGMGRPEESARVLADAGHFVEAAGLLADAGDRAAALERLVRMPVRDPRYREGAREAVRLAILAGAVGVRFEQFVGAFIDAGPREDEDLAAFEALGELYVRLGMPENAEEVFAKLLEEDPDNAAVAAKLAALRDDTMTGDTSLAGLLGDDERFRRVASGGGARRDTALLSTDPALPPGSRTPPPRATTAAGATFAPGDLIAERYRVEAEIGRGGMASVYRAQDLELSESVALKVFRPMPQDEEGINRFRQELKVSRRLIHPNITRLYDIGVHEGSRYISMELLVGHSLERLCGTKWPARRGIDCLVQVCFGLSAAHAQGVIHRDIKPGNLFLTREGIAKIMDFGIARERAVPGVTQAGMIVGTPEYLSPEQISGGDAGDTSDLYALGVVAYEMFTGRKPFVHDDLVPLLQMHLVSPPVPPRQHAPQLPASLETVILTLLRKNPQERYPSARATAEALAAIRESSRP